MLSNICYNLRFLFRRPATMRRQRLAHVQALDARAKLNKQVSLNRAARWQG